jgi:glutamate racemase
MLFLSHGLLVADSVVDRFVANAREHPDGKAPYSFCQADYAAELSRLPIGVFDSGIGGLTVLEAILANDSFHNDTLQPGADGVPDFVDERFIYFGDQANMPYGNYPKQDGTDFLRELVLKDATFLLGNRYSVEGKTLFDKPPVKAIVIACNTATAYGLDDIRAAFSAWKVPVIVVGVVEAGARGVRETGAKQGESLGLLATAGTCASGAYPRLITRTLGLAGKQVPPMVEQGGLSLAATIEGDPAAKRSVADETREEVRLLLEAQRKGGGGKPLGAVVLGCTHYPLALGEIKAAFEEFRKQERYADLIAPDLVFVDPARWTANELFRELASSRLRMKAGQSCVLPQDQFFMSVANPACPAAKISADGTFETAYKYGRKPCNLSIEDSVIVPLMPDRIPVASRQLLENKLPLVWTRLSSAAALSE